MKRCPQCGRDYNDDSLSYCLDDGSKLLFGPAANEPQTVMLKGGALSAGAATQELSDSRSAEGTTSRTERAAGARGLNRWLFLAAVALAAVLVAGFLSYRYFWAHVQINSIAVMPFVNDSGNADVEYLSDGMTETLIGSLSRLPGLNVKARSSVFRYKGKDMSTRTIGQELGVQAILNGHVAERAGRLALSLELIDAVTENVIWSEKYDRAQADLVTLQNDIARDVSSKLRSRLSVADADRLTNNYSANAEAYQLYLLGRFHWNKRTTADIYKAINYYTQAAEKDPTYALAFAGLADAYIILQGYDKNVSPLETQQKAREYAFKALSLDDSLSEGHVSTALVLQNADFNYAAAEREFVRAIELDPRNTTAQIFYALLLTGSSRFQEADSLFRRALELEPASSNINRNYGVMLMLARQLDASEQQLRRTIDLDPGFQLGYFALASTFEVQGKFGEAVEMYAKAREIAGVPNEAAEMRASFAKGGWREFVLGFDRRNWMSDLRPQYIEAARFLSIGDKQKGLDALERAYTRRESFLGSLMVDPRFDTIREQPRYKSLVKKLGFPADETR